jgi:hypothetical protein
VSWRIITYKLPREPYRHRVAVWRELDEEEESLDRLRRWYRAIRARDRFGAPSAPTAERRLKECAEALESYAEMVYEAREP